MPIYEVQDAKGRTLELDGDHEPTDSELANIFSQAFPEPAKASPPPDFYTTGWGFHGVEKVPVEGGIAATMVPGETAKTIARAATESTILGQLAKKFPALEGPRQKVEDMTATALTPGGALLAATGVAVPPLGAGLGAVLSAPAAVSGFQETKAGLEEGDTSKILGGATEMALGAAGVGLGVLGVKEAAPRTAAEVQQTLVPESHRLMAPRTRMPEFTQSTLEPEGPPPLALPAPGESGATAGVLPESPLAPRTAGYKISLPVEPESAKAARQIWSKPIDVEAQVTGAEALRQLSEFTEEAKTPGKPYEPPTVNVDLRQLENMMQKNTVSKVESWADEVLNRKLRETSANPFLDPEFLAAAATKGAILFKRGVTAFDAWQSEMRQQFGRGLDDVLPKIYQQSKDYWEANKTARAAGAVGARAITPRYVAETSTPQQTILDFGSGPKAAHAESLREQGLNVTAHEFGANLVESVHDPKALERTYDTVFASNVLNVQASPDMLRDTLNQIATSTKDGGRAVFNYPESPRKSTLTPDQVESEIRNFFPTVTRVGGTKSAPLWEARKTSPPSETPSNQSLGIVPPGVAAGMEALSQTGQKLSNVRQGFSQLFKGIPNRRAMEQTIDGADTLAHTEGRQVENSLKLEGNKLDREATFAIIEADQNYSKLGSFLQQVLGKDLNAEKAIRHAMADYNRLQPLANKVKSILDAEIGMEQGVGIDVEFRDAYVPHILDLDLLMGTKRPMILAGGRGGLSTAFKKGRTFDTIFDAIEQGYKPKSIDVAEVVGHRVRAGQQLINRKMWAESLRSANDPVDNRPIVTDLELRSRGPGKPGFEVAPMGYVPREILPGVRIAVHEGYSRYFDALTGRSVVAESLPGKSALEVAGGIKHGLLLFDTFHASRILQKELFLTGGKAGYKKGLALLEYSDADLNKAVQQKEITPEMAQYAQQNRPTADLLMKNGLNVGRVQEALYNSLVRDMPVVGTFNRWVFEKMTRGAMLESGLIEFERQKAANPNWTDTQTAQYVARRLNQLYGNLGRQGIFKSASARDAARLAFLAPQWVESMVRTELGSARELAIDPFAHRHSIIQGTLAKSMGQGLAAYFVGTQLLNIATRGQFTWDNPEKGHKLDAWIPDVTGKTNGFFISPLAVVAEISHDLIRYFHSEGSLLKAASRIMSNKFSPFLRAEEVLRTGETPTREKIPDDYHRMLYAGLALAPTPIPAAPLVKTDYPGQLQRQLTASLGFKTEPAPTYVQRISRLAAEWNKSRGKTEAIEMMHVLGTGYGDLRSALRREDNDSALDALEKLRGQKRDSEIIRAFRDYEHRPFSGSKSDELKFRSTLTAEEREAYQKAIGEKKAITARLRELIKSNPKK